MAGTSNVDELWRWHVTGVALGRSSTPRRVSVEGLIVDAEGSGDALLKFLHTADCWDEIDQDEAITIELRPEHGVTR